MEAQPEHPTYSLAPQAGRFLRRLLELQLPMALGALLCYLVTRWVATSSSFATLYHPGTYLYATADVLFLTIPVVAWMIVRGHAFRYSLELAVAMLAPVATIVVLGELAGSAYRLWLLVAGYPAMSLGMLVYLFYRRDHFTGQRRRSGRVAHHERG